MNNIYLCSYDDGANNYQMIVVGENILDVLTKAYEAVAERFPEAEQSEIGVTQLNVESVYWLD